MDRRKHILLVGVIWLVLLPCFVFSQPIDNNYRFDHITPEDGLPHSLVFSIFQDEVGFIWFGTSNGLARFDGYNFKVFQPDPELPNAISHKAVDMIYADKDKNLWLVLLRNGVNRFNPATETFDSFIYDRDDVNSLSSNDVTSFLCDSRVNVWIGTLYGLNCYDKQKNGFRRYFKATNSIYSLPGNQINDLEEDKSGNVWVATENGVAMIEQGSGKIFRLSELVNRSDFYLSEFNINAITSDQDGNIWISTSGKGVLCFNKSKKQLSQYLSSKSGDNLPPANITNSFVNKEGDLFFFAVSPYYIMIKHDHRTGEFTKINLFESDIRGFIANVSEDSEYNLWISTWEGLIRFNNRNHQVTHFRNDPFDKGSIQENQIQDALIDNNDILWLSIYRKGIDKVDLKSKKFTYYNKGFYNRPRALPDNNVVPMIKDRNGNLWVGIQNFGVVKLNQDGMVVKSYTINNNDPDQLHSFSVGTLCEDKQGNIWVGYWSGQMDVINPITHKIRHFEEGLPGKDHFPAHSIRIIVPDSTGNLWIATATHGIVEYISDKDQFKFHSVDCEHGFVLNGFYRTVYVDRKNQIWAGSQSGGLQLYDKKACRFYSFRHHPDDKQSISSNAVYCIYQENDSIYWVGTTNGLNRFNCITQTFLSYNTHDGLCNNTVYSVLPDGAGNLWISTDHGLARFNIKTTTFTNYFESDGLLSSEFNSNAYYKASDGTLYFGSPKGMVSFLPSALINDSHMSVPVLTELKVYNMVVNPGDTVKGHALLDKVLALNDTITIDYVHNNFILEFSALHYTSPEKIRYKYILEGFDDNWVITDAKHRYAAYTNLPAGEYIFRLRSTNNDGIWCDESLEEVLTIVVNPPFWKTLWFIGLLAVLGVLMILALFQLRVYRLNRQKLQLAIQVKQRTFEIEEANESLKQIQKETYEQKEKLQTQNVVLEKNNELLKQQQEEIFDKNTELDRHRNELENLIKERTADLELARKKAEESDRLKSEFLANMSHEIRTPMNAIVGFSSLLNSDLTAEEMSQFFEVIKKSSDSLLVLIDDILDISRIQANQMVVDRMEFDLIPVLKEVEVASQFKAQEKGIVIRCVLDDFDKIICVADIFRTRQVLSNLVDNAIKYTEKGVVELGVDQIREGFVTLFVKDSGIGIPPEIGESVFQRFLKVNQENSRFQRGVGLGLAISKSLTEMMGGRIWYRSDSKGTTFFFTLPHKTQ